ncbi:MAG: IS21 family transposase [Actinomycetota bacterium]|nr:IS21 family transposase [Actinomycetota bacterium]
MLPKEKPMEVLEAYDLTKSYRCAAQLTGVDHHTVAKLVAARALGTEVADEPTLRSKTAEAFADKITEWIERSSGKVRADVVHDKLVAMGYRGSARTTRRVVAALKAAYHHDRHRVYKPWITEPGAWLQYDFGAGPVIDGVAVVLFCAWLAWSRYRVIVPLGDRTWPSVVAALDTTFRRVGGAPTYVLTDNERTVTDRHIAGIAVRNQQAVALSRYYGVTIATCVPADPESKGGSESTVKIAKADLVPTEYNLVEHYASFAELEAACDQVAEQFNTRVHAVTKATPDELLAIERPALHPIPDQPYTVAFGESRSVGWSATVSFRGARYSVPDRLAGGQVWVRAAAGEVVIVAGEGAGAHEVARHDLLAPGGASIRDEHYPARAGRDPLHRQPKATKPSEAAFLALGEGARLYLVEAAGVGGRRIEARMAEAVALAALHGPAAIDVALGIAAMAGRFAEGDLESIVVHAQSAPPARPGATPSLAAGTSVWSGLGTTCGEDQR